MPYKARINPWQTQFPVQQNSNGVWALFKRDVYFIKTQNVNAGKIEVHWTESNNFDITSTGTCLSMREGKNGTFLMASWVQPNESADLVFIKTRNTKNGAVEVHVVSQDSDYQAQVCDEVSCFPAQEGENGKWGMLSNGDLVQIKTRGTATGKVELHVASRSSKYKEYVVHEETCFDSDNMGIYCVADTPNKTWSLFFLGMGGSISDNVMVHVASSDSKWKTSTLDTDSQLANNLSGTYLMHNYLTPPGGWPELCCITDGWSQSGKVEVYAYKYLGPTYDQIPDPTNGLRVEKGDRIRILIPNDFCGQEVTITGRPVNERPFDKQYYLVTFYNEDRGRSQGPLFVSKSVVKNLRSYADRRRRINKFTIVVDDDFNYGQNKNGSMRWLILDDRERSPDSWEFVESLRTALGKAFWSFADGFFDSLGEIVENDSYRPENMFMGGSFFAYADN